MAGRTIITAAITGAWPKKENNSNVPLTLSEIIGDVYERWKAGAAVARLYVRDDVGNGIVDKEKFRETLELLKPRYPGCNIILNLTTSGDLAVMDEARQVHLEGPRLEMASYDCGSMNWPNSSLFIDSPKFPEELGNNIQEWNTKPEIEVLDSGMVANAAYYLKKSMLRASLHFQSCVGCASGIPGIMKNLALIKEMMESLCPNSTWGCLGVGHCAMEMPYGTVAVGGHVRVGMEDDVLYKKGQLAGDNAELVDRTVRVIREFGSQPATPDEVRQLLGLIKG